MQKIFLMNVIMGSKKKRDSVPIQSAYTFYILGLNLILATFSDQAVTALGLYYKWQTFFFIPLGAMQTCIVPIISFNYATGKYITVQKDSDLRDWFWTGIDGNGNPVLCFCSCSDAQGIYPGCKGHCDRARPSKIKDTGAAHRVPDQGVDHSVRNPFPYSSRHTGKYRIFQIHD